MWPTNGFGHEKWAICTFHSVPLKSVIVERFDLVLLENVLYELLLFLCQSRFREGNVEGDAQHAPLVVVG